MLTASQGIKLTQSVHNTKGMRCGSDNSRVLSCNAERTMPAFVASVSRSRVRCRQPSSV